MTPTQRRVHRPWAGERSQILWAFARSEDPALQKRARSMAACCCSPIIQQLQGGGLRLVPIRCRDRLCPLCAHRRARDAAAKYGRAVGMMGAARHLVLTAPAVDAPLAEQLRDLRAAVKRLRQADGWRQAVIGGVYTVEITRNKSSGLWHPHVHLVVDGHFYPQRQACSEWRAALAGRGAWKSMAPDAPVIVHISAVHNRHQLAKYIAKYIAKPAGIGGWPEAAVCELATATHGVRMMHTFGSLHGVKLGAEEPNATTPAEQTLIGLSELDWRARQGWREARAAIALVRTIWPACGAWIGTASEGWELAEAAEIEDQQAELASLLMRVRQLSATARWSPPRRQRPKPPRLPWPDPG